jgi:hypothetical protein
MQTSFLYVIEIYGRISFYHDTNDILLFINDALFFARNIMRIMPQENNFISPPRSMINLWLCARVGPDRDMRS